MQPYNSPNNVPYTNPYNTMNNPINMAAAMAPQGSIMAWVQGRPGADSYPLGANMRGYLFDTNDDKFYLKVTDMTGVVQPIRAFNYKEEVQQPVAPSSTLQNEQNNYVTKDEMKDLISEAIMSLKSELVEKPTNGYVKGGKTNGKRFVSGANEAGNDGSVQ